MRKLFVIAFCLLLSGCAVNKPIPVKQGSFPPPHNGAHRDAVPNQYKAI